MTNSIKSPVKSPKQIVFKSRSKSPRKSRSKSSSKGSHKKWKYHGYTAVQLLGGITALVTAAGTIVAIIHETKQKQAEYDYNIKIMELQYKYQKQKTQLEIIKTELPKNEIEKKDIINVLEKNLEKDLEKDIKTGEKIEEVENTINIIELITNRYQANIITKDDFYNILRAVNNAKNTSSTLTRNMIKILDDNGLGFLVPSNRRFFFGHRRSRHRSRSRQRSRKVRKVRGSRRSRKR